MRFLTAWQCSALLGALALLSNPAFLPAQSSGSLIFAPEPQRMRGAQVAAPAGNGSTAKVSQIGPFPADEIIPADPTQLPSAAPPAQPGCSCAGCRSGAGHTGAPYADGGQPALLDDCPPAVISEGWCQRPCYFDGFVGAVFGDEFVNGQINQQTSFLAGLRLGWDLDEAWGLEGRFAISDFDISNASAPADTRQADVLMLDASLVHYFFTDLTTRPFVSFGLGVVEFDYVDASGIEREEQAFGVPVGIGIKHRYDDWLVFRFDLTDNMAFAGGTELGTQHNVSVTGSFELRFGGRRMSYWPWQPRRYYCW
jgi:hypothetical protein